MKTYRIILDKDKRQGVKKLSLVNSPAIKENFMALSEEVQMNFSNEKMQVVGAILIPDTPIDRFSDNLGEHKVVFDQESVKDLHSQLMEDGVNAFNIEHALDLRKGDAYIREVWSKDSENDKSKDYGMGHLPLGTIFANVQIKNEDAWKSIKGRELNGFSVEMVSSLEEISMSDSVKELVDAYKELKSELLKEE